MGTTIFVISIIIGIAALAVWKVMSMQREEDDRFPETPPAPLTFGSMVGAIVLGNLLTAMVGAILWVLLLKNIGL